ncbi:MAG TPA: hypothetical protein VE715_23000 [Blastocatellia bacterium]|nr:hypothetical protein [Blastocatellia bacterium]
MKPLVAIFLLILLPHISTLSQVPTQSGGKFSAAGLDNDREVEQFFISFKGAVAKNDRKKVASLIDFPIEFFLASGSKVKIKNEADFLGKYDQIFDETFKQVILQTKVKDLWARDQGVAMPSGEIWINKISKDVKRPEKYTLKITTINGPFRPHKSPKSKQEKSSPR